MGLIPSDHPHQLTRALEKKLVETFALQIINEYDEAKKIRYPKRDIKAHKYMATRYLQLQHASKSGATSGDGRSMWNGTFSQGGSTWDISSCGTGATKLSPHYAETGKPVRTGDPRVCYGSGWADAEEGLSAAIMSEIFHSRGILTERTLVIMRAPKGNAINVRAARNLIRPSHLFLYLKQNNPLQLRRAVDYFIQRQSANGEWDWTKQAPARFDHFLGLVARRYAEFAAQLEDEYIFHWMDWDGDNMLTGGGIIDYGSIRQFGLFHHHYRYDDVDRFSTNLKEQKYKARALVQTFAQLVDFLKSNARKELAAFDSCAALRQFDREFRLQRSRLFLRRMGFSSSQQRKLLGQHPRLVQDLFRSFRYFESKEATTSLRTVPDGVNRPAAYAAKKLLRELPQAYLRLNAEKIEPVHFLQMLKSSLTPKKLLRPTPNLLARIDEFQSLYLRTVKASGSDVRRSLLEITMRGSAVNAANHITGDAIIFVVESLLRRAKKLKQNDFLALVDHFIAKHVTGVRPTTPGLSQKTQKALLDLVRMVEKSADSI